jgi:hypothetical protein
MPHFEDEQSDQPGDESKKTAQSRKSAVKDVVMSQSQGQRSSQIKQSQASKRQSVV